MPGKFSCSRARQSRDPHQTRVCSKASISHLFGCPGETGGWVSPGRGTGRTQKSCDFTHACKPELGIFWPVVAFRLLAHLHPGLIFEPHYSVRGGTETQLNWTSTEDFQKLHFFANLFRWSNYLEVIQQLSPPSGGTCLLPRATEPMPRLGHGYPFDPFCQREEKSSGISSARTVREKRR